jgi:SAM-dependent methyltransferase
MTTSIGSIFSGSRKMDCPGNNILVETPCAGFRLREMLFRETAYGIVRRLRLLRGWIEAERARRNLAPEELRILDVGCGTGVNVTIPLAEMGYRVIGVDTDKPSVERGRRIAEGVVRLDLRCGPLAEAVGEDAVFHVAICSEVFEHLERPEELLGQIVLRLARGGLVIVTVPNGYGYFEFEAFVAKLLPGLPGSADRWQQCWIRRYGSPELRKRQVAEGRPEHYQTAWSTMAPAQSHCRRFTSRSVRRLMGSQRLDIVEMRNCTVLAGNILNAVIRDCDRLLAWNGTLADRLPHWMCSGWLLVARRKET